MEKSHRNEREATHCSLPPAAESADRTLPGVGAVSVAIVGLMLAFAAALFSTVSREAGSVWGTVVLASVALLLATFVGLTTVPYLARRVVASRVREAMDYDVTRAGMIYILISVVIGIAAINTGNNLLYVIVASLLSAIMVSGIASALVLRSLCARCALARTCVCGASDAGAVAAAQCEFVAAVFFRARGSRETEEER